MNDLKNILALSYLPSLGILSIKKLIEHFGSAEAVWSLSLKEIREIKGIRKEIIHGFQDKNKYLELAEKEIDFAKKNEISCIPFWDKNYPDLLRECVDAPPVIFTKGNLDLHSGKFVSIVGTRKMTAIGKDFIHELVAGFRNLPITIVSGLAMGVDVEAHKAAIENKLPTIGVLAHSVSKIYPKQNLRVGRAMQSNGGLLSEFSSFHKALPENFLRRNRIIAGLCHATIVVESGIAGGAMSTARCANLYNRDVFAKPGRVNDIHSQGCHHLIKTHQAFLITEAKDVLQFLNLQPRKKKKIQQELFIDLNKEQLQVVDFLRKNGKQHIDQLGILLHKSTYEVLPILLDLELKNVVSPLPGKFYEI